MGELEAPVGAEVEPPDDAEWWVEPWWTTAWSSWVLAKPNQTQSGVFQMQSMFWRCLNAFEVAGNVMNFQRHPILNIKWVNFALEHGTQ